MLFQYLDTLRQKPKQTRNQYAFGFAVGFTFLIAGVWSLSLPARFSNLGGMAAVGSASSTVSTTPFSGLVDQLKQQFAGVKDAIQAMPSTTSTPAQMPGSVSSSTQIETENALNMQINEENKTALEASSSGDAGTYHLDTEQSAHPMIIIATTSDTVKR
jgi:hypothetical protein